jgi:PKD repeat protein
VFDDRRNHEIVGGYYRYSYEPDPVAWLWRKIMIRKNLIIVTALVALILLINSVSADPSPATITIGNVNMNADGTSTANIVMSGATTGLSGYKLNLNIVNTAIADNITSVSYSTSLFDSFDTKDSSWSAAKYSSNVNTLTYGGFKDGYVKAASGEGVADGSTNIVLATVTLHGKSVGTTTLHGSLLMMDDNYGGDYLPVTTVVDGTITVSGPPTAEFAASTTTPAIGETVTFTDLSTGTPTIWAWDFNNDGTTDSTLQNPTYAYTAPGTYTVKLTVSNAVGNDDEIKTGYITVSGPDLVVTTISPNVGAGAAMFALEPNVISVTVKNQGAGAAGASTVSVTDGSSTVTAAVGALAAGANTTVTVTDPALNAGGSTASLVATADSAGVVAESDETNNALTTPLSVYNNGYKGKRYATGGSDMNTQATYEGRYDLKYSAGDSAYKSNKWTSATDTWTSADLAIPSGATVVSARLYQPWGYNKMASDPGYTAAFNTVTVTPVATYKDTKGFGTYNYPYGVNVYDVTSQFSTAGNTLVLTPEGTAGTTNDYCLFGAYLVVTYSDPSTTVRKIWINDEFDMIMSSTPGSGSYKYSTTDEESTVFANFANVDSAGVASAKTIAILASAADAEKSRFYFNNNEYTGFWSNYLSTPQIGFSVFDVTGAVASGANNARL